MNSNKKETTHVIAVVGLAAIFVLALAIIPLALASSQSANNQIEVIRAQTHYKPASTLVFVPPVVSFSAGLSPDMKLIRASQLQAAGDS